LSKILISDTIILNKIFECESVPKFSVVVSSYNTEKILVDNKNKFHAEVAEEFISRQVGGAIVSYFKSFF